MLGGIDGQRHLFSAGHGLAGHHDTCIIPLPALCDSPALRYTHPGCSSSYSPLPLQAQCRRTCCYFTLALSVFEAALVLSRNGTNAKCRFVSMKNKGGRTAVTKVVLLSPQPLLCPATSAVVG